MTSLYNITGVQPGAYFGYSIAVGDFNGKIINGWLIDKTVEC